MLYVKFNKGLSEDKHTQLLKSEDLGERGGERVIFLHCILKAF
jgi:hypothetical protein